MALLRILIINNNELERNKLRSLLSHEDYDLAEAVNGIEALKLLRETPIHLMITDILMTEMDGLTLCRECKKDPLLHKIPIIFYTSTFTDDQTRALTHTIGAFRFIIKSDTPKELLNAIHAALHDQPEQASQSRLSTDDHQYAKQQGTVLIRKLEERSLALAQTNAALEKSLKDCQEMSKKLEAHAVQMNVLMDHLPGMVYRCLNAREWTMTYVSRGCDQLTEYPPEALINNHLIAYNDLIHKDDREYVWHTIQNTNAKQTFFNLTYRIITASGKEKWVFERGHIFFKPGSSTAEIEGFIEDITVQQRALQKEQEQLVELRRWYTAMLGREARILELKKEINALLMELGRTPIYDSANEDVDPKCQHPTSHDTPLIT